MLTGKCKEAFEQYLWEKLYCDKDSIISWASSKYAFSQFPFSMQWGVYVDFFESEDIRMNIESEIDYIQAYVNDNDLGNHFQYIKEARIMCIEKANEIYNE